MFTRIQPEEFELSNIKPIQKISSNMGLSKSKFSVIDRNRQYPKFAAPVVFKQRQNNSKERYVKYDNKCRTPLKLLEK
jgi:hypothetical protein